MPLGDAASVKLCAIAAPAIIPVINTAESPLPSLDTDVCATETRKFNEKMAAKTAIKLSVISMDLPFAMGEILLYGGHQKFKSRQRL